MPKIAYDLGGDFKPASLTVINRAAGICQDYAGQGYSLTLRQLYYRFVAQGWLPNTERSYKNLGALVNRARLAGLIDWYHIEDRGRSLFKSPSWTSPASIIESAARGYAEDLWLDQQYAVEVWVEKQALEGVVSRAADVWRAPYFSCKGYSSASSIWEAGQRHIRYQKNGKQPVILYLGDHDPSGIDMPRDIADRMRLFCEHHGYDKPTIRRIALNMDQVLEHEPPPNPAKVTDSRFQAYQEEHGEESWELDALEPQVLDDLIQATIREYVDEVAWEAAKAAEEHQRGLLLRVSGSWTTIQDLDDAGEL
jgi:hypothetical protein